MSENKYFCEACGLRDTGVATKDFLTRLAPSTTAGRRRNPSARRPKWAATSRAHAVVARNTKSAAENNRQIPVEVIACRCVWRREPALRRVFELREQKDFAIRESEFAQFTT